MKMFFNEILNIFKVLFVQLTRLLSFIIGKDSKDTKQVNKTTKVEVKKEETKEEKPVKEVAKKEPKLDLNILTVSELRELAKKKEIKGYSKLKKEELIEVLK